MRAVANPADSRIDRPTAQFGGLLYDTDTRTGRYLSYALYGLNIVLLSL